MRTVGSPESLEHLLNELLIPLVVPFWSSASPTNYGLLRRVYPRSSRRSQSLISGRHFSPISSPRARMMPRLRTKEVPRLPFQHRHGGIWRLFIRCIGRSEVGERGESSFRRRQHFTAAISTLYAHQPTGRSARFRVSSFGRMKYYSVV